MLLLLRAAQDALEGSTTAGEWLRSPYTQQLAALVHLDSFLAYSPPGRKINLPRAADNGRGNDRADVSGWH